LKTGEAVERQLGEFQSDFPRINEEYTGRKNRYVYTALFQDATHPIGIAKYDLTLEPELGKEKLEVGGNVAGIFWFGNQRFGSDPVYVPKKLGREADEDDGYLLCFVFDENTWKSEVVVIDARTMSPEPVAVIELPTRVPYGFHAMFANEDKLRLQKS
jgi:carotenoid cleavage dioxygenase-like enzyme